jgi:hypothetical protein
MNSAVTATATCQIDDPDGDIIIQARVLSPGHVSVKFSENSNHKNSEVCDATLNIGVRNP